MHDITSAVESPHVDETVVYANAGYQGIDKHRLPASLVIETIELRLRSLAKSLPAGRRTLH